MAASRFLLITAACVAASHSSPPGSARLDRALPAGSTDYVLQYDDGSAWWLTWAGTYRGTWFDLEDFMPGAPGWSTEQSEYWFYHHYFYPWDTASFYSEVWDGDVSMPSTQVDQTSVTAVHYSPVYANYSTPLYCEPQFWVLVNTGRMALTARGRLPRLDRHQPQLLLQRLHPLGALAPPQSGPASPGVHRVQGLLHPFQLMVWQSAARAGHLGSHQVDVLTRKRAQEGPGRQSPTIQGGSDAALRWLDPACIRSRELPLPPYRRYVPARYLRTVTLADAMASPEESLRK